MKKASLRWRMRVILACLAVLASGRIASATATGIPSALVPKQTLVLEKRGVIEGYPGGDLGLERALTRAEAAKIVCEVLALCDRAVFQSPSGVVFEDVPASHWAARYIAFAWENGIVRGYGDGTFRPERTVTVAEMAVMLARVYREFDPEMIPYGLPASEEGINPGWVVPEIWSLSELVDLLRGCGLFATNLDRPMMRSETVTLIYGFMERVGLLFDVEGWLERVSAGGMELEKNHALMKVPLSTTAVCIVGDGSGDVSALRAGMFVRLILDRRGECVCVVSE